MSKLSRTRGHDFEREIAAEFRELGFTDCQTKRAARGGDWSQTDDGIDLVNTGEYSVQLKRGRKYANPNKIEEVQQLVRCPPRAEHGFARRVDENCCIDCDNPPSEHIPQVPLLLTRADKKKTIACMYWEDLKKLIQHSPN